MEQSGKLMPKALRTYFHSAQEADKSFFKEVFRQAVLNELKEKVRNSNIPILVELFDWAHLPAKFGKNILARHELLYSNLPGQLN